MRPSKNEHMEDGARAEGVFHAHEEGARAEQIGEIPSPMGITANAKAARNHQSTTKPRHFKHHRPPRSKFARIWFAQVRYAWWKMLGLLTKSRLQVTRVDGLSPHHAPTPDDAHEPKRAPKTHPAVQEIWAVACCAPTDGPYIEEWVRYHLGDGGLDGVYIIDNHPEGTLELSALSAETALKGRLIVAHDPELFINHISHPRVLHRHLVKLRAKGRWILCIDNDEFGFPREGERAVKDPQRLHHILQGHAGQGHTVVAFPTVNYGEADEEIFERTGSLLMACTHRAPLPKMSQKSIQRWRTYKTAFYTPDYLGMVNPHLPLMRAGVQPILHTPSNYWIHHYFFRNRAFAEAKRARRKLLNIPLETEHEEQWRRKSKSVEDAVIPQTSSVRR